MSLLVTCSNSIRAARVRSKRARLERLARRTGTVFGCRVLCGLSDYNLSINSDMSVSCNCQDDGGAGILGNLSDAALEDVFRGSRASSFRATLAAGRLPILTCASCAERLTVDRAEGGRLAREVSVPKQGIMVENTAACNLSCVACERARVVRSRKRLQMSLDDIRRVSQTIRKHGIETLYFFKYGEPFLSSDILEELRIIRGDNPSLRIVISTNGVFVDTDSRREAALMADLVYFSLDGISDAVVRKYQRGGSFDKAHANMRELAGLRNARGLKRPSIEWKYVVFNWNDRPAMIRRAIELAREAGVDVISFWPTTVPYHGTSWRYRWSPFWKTVGQASWKGREVVLNA